MLKDDRKISVNFVSSGPALPIMQLEDEFMLDDEFACDTTIGGIVSLVNQWNDYRRYCEFSLSVTTTIGGIVSLVNQWQRLLEVLWV